VGGACGSNGGRRGTRTSFWVGKPEGKRPLGRPSRMWVDNIKMAVADI
jgi:hypothetical protein